MSGFRSTTANEYPDHEPLSLAGNLAYLIDCARANRASKSADRDALSRIHRIRGVLRPLTELESALDVLDGVPSPIRFYCRAAWASVLDHVVDRLGAVRILEIGCGRGYLFDLFAKVLGDSLVQYTGTDLHRHTAWSLIEKADPRTRFVECRAERLPEHLLREANLIVSQSVLEHVEGDLEFFWRHREHMQAGHPVVQIHAVPAAASLFLYLRHGWRQYTLGSIAKIAAVYPESRCSVIELGGTRSNLLHFLTVRVPSLLHFRVVRNEGASWYNRLLRLCYEQERVQRSTMPSFYVIVIETNLERSLFRGGAR